MNGFNLSTISDLYVGSTQYSAIYLGLQKIWERNTEYINQYLTIESLEDNNVISFTSAADETIQRTIWVNKNNTSWYSVTSGPEIQVATLNRGDKLRIYGSSSTYTYSKDGTENNSCIFGSTKTVNLYGNICTLLTDGNIPTSSIDLASSQYNYCFGNIFRYLLVVDASNLVFGAIDKMGYYTCYDMFQNCTSLISAPELPTLNLGECCYYYMFASCTSLTTPPSILPAPILASNCYSQMFRNCTSLTSTPALPATTLADYCYNQMFIDCTSLTTVPSILPAITLSNRCYLGMFRGCTSLTTAPVLPATTLVSGCYRQMFYGCSSLNYIKALFTSTTDSGLGYTGGWVTDVAASGTFIKSPDATWNITGNNGVPTGWTVVQYNNQYLTIESLEDNNIISFYSTADETIQRTISVRVNSSEWYNVTSGPNTTIATLNTGDKLEIYGNSETFRYSKDGTENNSCIFGSSKTVNLYGNICCLLTNGDLPINMDLSVSKYSYCFAWLFAGLNVVDASNLVFPITKMPLSGFSSMFQGCISLTTAPTILPTTTLASNCYESMFRDCISLTTAPALPTTTLVQLCYYYMFDGCTSLTSAPALPATTLAYGCYGYMFTGCTSLTTAPTLPATTLAEYCYRGMFMSCTSLTTAPVLSATTLAGSCYIYMFNGCTSLTTSPTLPATTLAKSCYNYMFRGCTSLTTAPELPATALAENCYSSMFRDCTSLTTAPELPATALVKNCYNYMFNNCSSLNYIKALFKTLPTSTTNNWVSGVAASGTFVKSSDATWNITGNNGVPKGWTIIRV